MLFLCNRSRVKLDRRVIAKQYTIGLEGSCGRGIAPAHSRHIGIRPNKIRSSNH